MCMYVRAVCRTKYCTFVDSPLLTLNWCRYVFTHHQNMFNYTIKPNIIIHVHNNRYINNELETRIEYILCKTFFFKVQ